LVTEDGAGFHNEGLDDVKRKTELRFLPPPSRLAINRAAFDFELAPNSGRSLFITVLCEDRNEPRIDPFEFAFRTRRLFVPKTHARTTACEGRFSLPRRMPKGRQARKEGSPKVPFKSGSSPCYTYKMSGGGASGAETETDRARIRRADLLVSALGRRSIVLIGLMGSGKTSTGRRLAQELGLEFVDADEEIEAAARLSITEIFARHGEDAFRDGERRVMARLLRDGPRVLASGGGAFMNEGTRAKIALSGITVWLKADHDVLWRRVRKRSHRPLLQGGDPEQTLRTLLEQRYPVYALADVTIVSRDGPHELAVEEIISGIECFLRSSPDLSPLARPKNVTVSHQQQGAGPQQFSNRAQVSVELGARTYTILIGAGLIAEAGNHIRRLAPRAACAIVTDENVAKLHLPTLERALDEAFVRHSRVVVAPGEGSKSLAEYARVCNALIGAKLERGDVVVALGGGVIGDLAGFAAATVRRGMRFIQVPTTLLAKVDSSVGGKTGINSPHGKNLIGAFHQPLLVIADTDTLETLPPREFRAGYAEIVKYGLIGDAGFYAWLEANWRAVFAGGAARVHAIATSCKAKAVIVARDEFDEGERALLNLGHTFGHALERLTSYDGARLVHGEAVAIGMACAFRFSARVRLCGVQDQARVEAHLQEVGLPVRMAGIPGWNVGPEAILEAMYQDKKVAHGALTFILARAIGDSFIAKNIEASEILGFLQDELNIGH
jgi:shikimate kinase/3-dehydroquinate synthase